MNINVAMQILKKSQLCLGVDLGFSKEVTDNGISIYYVQHNEHAKYANARGSGVCPQENLKN